AIAVARAGDILSRSWVKRAIEAVTGAVLVALGLQALAAAVRGRRKEAEAPRSKTLEPRRAFRQGLLSNLGNPKMAAFFPSLLPQFAHSFPALLALGFMFCLMTLVWLTAYAVAVARAGDFLSRSWVKRAIEAVTGAVLVALGLRLATEQR
ncbi:MAG TPA: LysE family translocator, partial [Gaiellaceae bacterium]|nr:LysE family translocator [Gaiellaceae bacterium]